MKTLASTSTPTAFSSATFAPAAAAAALCMAGFAHAATPAAAQHVGTAPVTAMGTTITAEQVLAAQKAWGEALVAISAEYEKGGQAAAKTLAAKVIDGAYGYQMGPVLFKPTLTTAPQTFRTTRDGALAYFVGGDKNFPADTGFALKGWRSVEIKNAALFISGDTATTMGNVSIKNKDGQVTTVDKTWKFQRDAQGALRIVAHHSSLPFTAAN
ncbi:MAG: hypothetical protein MUE43_10530 [Serpentinimonas sp.]|nr:hypothetical protein [Serpentinimonas sp.]